MIKKGLPVKKAIIITAPGKKIVIGDPKPTADKRKSSKTKACKSSTKSGHADGTVNTGSVTTLSPLLSKATASKLDRLKRKTAAAKRASPAKTTEKVAGNPARDEECTSILKKQKKSPANDAVAAKGQGNR